MTRQSGAGAARYQLLDIARGLAILAMVVFHIGWDLYYFGLSNTDVTTELGWVLFQKAILSSFLLLVGAGLVLAHGRGVRWERFWRRFGILVCAALLVTAGTYWMFPEFFVFFGVLHAIALFSLLGLAFLRVPTWLLLVLGVAVIGADLFYSDPMFSSRELGWIGFWPTSPPTSDVVPIFPWFGVVLLGMAGMRLILGSPLATGLRELQSPQPAARGLAVLGRWSLLVYLVHQPILIALIFGLTQLQSPVLSPPVESRAEAFRQSCVPSCTATGSDAERCARYCDCALEQVGQNNLWEAVSASPRNPEQQKALDSLSTLCTAMAD